MLKYYDQITKTLTIPSGFNKKLKVSPIDTKIIIFNEDLNKNNCSQFNQEIKENILPVSLHTLSLGYDFNQEIKENVLPVSLHTLSFGYCFNKEIKEKVLPYSLHTLNFGGDFKQEIKENVLPVSLHTLTFMNYSSFNQEIKENVLPKSLHNLTFGFYFNQIIKNNVLPKSIKNICLWSHCNLINNLPLWIEEVYIMFGKWNDKYDKEVNNLPITLKKIIIKDEKYLKYITKIPFGCDIVIKVSNK
jgi:hypothetical protein